MTPRGLFKLIVPLTALGMLAAGEASGEWASRGGHVVLPESSIEQPEHVGLRAHTNFKMFMPNAGMAARQTSPEAAPQANGPPFRGISTRHRHRSLASISS
jgi:hypothetical protein